VNILAVSGSLRAASINSALLRVARQLAPPGIDITLCTVVGELPLFNPDLEDQPPASVVQLRAQVAAADALLIASPEYAHGVTGAIKNTLDWLVSFEPFINKPVAVLNASPRAHHADDALRETLRTMSAVIVESASVSIPLLGSGVTEQDMAAAPAIVDAILASLDALRRSTESPAAQHAPCHPINNGA
jgi:chromate reductase